MSIRRPLVLSDLAGWRDFDGASVSSCGDREDHALSALYCAGVSAHAMPHFTTLRDQGRWSSEASHACAQPPLGRRRKHTKILRKPGEVSLTIPRRCALECALDAGRWTSVKILILDLVQAVGEPNTHGLPCGAAELSLAAQSLSLCRVAEHAAEPRCYQP